MVQQSILQTTKSLDEKFGKDRLPGVRASADVPLIGILTQAVVDDKKNDFDFDEYILGINHRFMSLAGARPVQISYLSDEPEDERRLYEILD